MQEILRVGRVSPAQAAKMRGRLGFTQTLMFGKFGRVQLQPFSNRQYSRAVRGAHPLNSELREVSHWRVNIPRTVSERRTMAQWPRPVAIYADAAGCGHLGAKVFMDDEELKFSTHCTGRLHGDDADIYDFEMTASLFGMALAAELRPGRPVILCCDNTAASQTPVRGSCKTDTARMMCGNFWTIAATFGAPVWVESVNGVLTPIDPPSSGLHFA